MFLNKLKSKAGLTLVELIVVLAVASIVLGGIFTLFAFGNKTYGRGQSQYGVQSDVRIVSDYIQRQIRYSTYVELIDYDKMMEEIILSIEEGEGHYDNEYRYIYFDEANKRMVHLVLNGDTENPEYETAYQFGSTIESLSFSKENDTTIRLRVVGVDIGSNFLEQVYQLNGDILLPNLFASEIMSEDSGNFQGVIRYSNSIDHLGYTDIEYNPPTPSIAVPTNISGGPGNFTLTFSIDIKEILDYPYKSSSTLVQENDNSFTVSRNSGNFSHSTQYHVKILDINDNEVNVTISRSGQGNAWRIE